MSEKVYKPIIKDGDHLIHSKINPERVRGLTRDENNHNQDIIEWEEYDVNDLQNNYYSPYSYEEPKTLLTEEEEKLAQQLGEILGTAIVTGGALLLKEGLYPWLKDKVLPWAKGKGSSIKSIINKKIKHKTDNLTKTTSNLPINSAEMLKDVSSQIDEAFDQIYIDMDKDELESHIIKILFYMFGLANEIRTVSDATLKKACESEELYIERKKELEIFMSEKLAVYLNQLLGKDNMRLDINISKKIFSLTGGGVYINGEYAPVQLSKIDETIKSIHVKELTS